MGLSVVVTGARRVRFFAQHGDVAVLDPTPWWDPLLCGRLLGSDCTVLDQRRSGGRAPGGTMPSSSSPLPSSRSAPSLDGHRQQILAINNDPAVLALFRDLLEEAGYQVAIQTYVDRDVIQIKALKPDLIILDYMWANEDASWSLLQMLRMDPTTVDIPIVLCTGAVHEVKALEEHLVTMGVTVVLKPFNIDQLVDAIRERLGADRVLRPIDAER
jgi:CheY-like chemotaxis protein